MATAYALILASLSSRPSPLLLPLPFFHSLRRGLTTTNRNSSQAHHLFWQHIAITNSTAATSPQHIFFAQGKQQHFSSGMSAAAAAAAAERGGDDDRPEEAAERMMGSVSRGKRGKRGGGGGGGGRGGRRGGGGGSSGQDRDVVLSKALSTLLRHQAQNAGIKLDDEGFAPLDKVLQWPRLRSLNPTVAEIKAAVSDSAKQRFALKPNPDPKVVAGDDDDNDPAAWLIRANQGHSIALASEGLHTPITLEAANVPAVVVHGTYFAFWDSIVAAGGLRRMGRTHVHFGTGLLPSDDDDVVVGRVGHEGGGGSSEEKEREQREADAEEEEERKIIATAPGRPQVISGMRGDAELLVFVDVEQSLRDGGGGGGGENAIKWWISANGVVLTEGDADGVVPLRYFKEVRGRRQGVGVLWRDGRKVADLPDGVVKRVPMGKTGGGERSGRGGGKGRRGGGGGGGKGQKQERGGR